MTCLHRVQAYFHNVCQVPAPIRSRWSIPRPMSGLWNVMPGYLSLPTGGRLSLSHHRTSSSGAADNFPYDPSPLQQQTLRQLKQHLTSQQAPPHPAAPSQQDEAQINQNPRV